MHHRIKPVDKSAASLISAFTTIPAGTTDLSIGDIYTYNLLKERTDTELARAFRLIPPSVISLDLTHMLIWSVRAFCLAVPFIPPTVASLNLSKNQLGNSGGGGPLIAYMLAVIPRSVKSLNLSDNGLCHKLCNKRYGHTPGDDLATILKAISSSIISLDLSENHFIFDPNINLSDGNRGLPDFIEALAAIPINVRELDLSDNYFGKEESSIVMAGIPASITTLKLARHKFGFYPCSNLIKIFSAIPATVISLNLEHNYFNHVSAQTKSNAALCSVLAALPPTVKSLNLSGNELDKKTEAEWVELLSRIPATVTTIICAESQHLINKIISKVRTSVFTLLNSRKVLPVTVIPSLVLEYVSFFQPITNVAIPEALDISLDTVFLR